MSRLAATLALDARLQARNRIYVVIGIVALALALPLRALFTPAQLHFFMPVLALSGVGLTALLLVGVLVMLERGEGTLDVVLVSPLRPHEYLASKILTVSALAVVEGVAIALVTYGPGFSVGWLVIAIALRAGLVAAVGIAVAVRYRQLTEFLVPLAALGLLLDLPLVWYFQLSTSPVFLLLPTAPSLLLARAAFFDASGASIAWGLVGGTAGVALAVAWALRSLDRFVVRGERPA